MPYIKPHRSHYIPKGATRYADKLSSAVVYAYSNAAGMPLLIGFHGKAQKPDFHYRYANEERRTAKAKAHFEAIRAREAYAIEQRAKRNAEGHELKVGSILRSSWGYDQTNVDFYQVTKLIGAKMVEIQQIAGEGFETLAMQGETAPMVGSFKGKPMRKRAQGDTVKIESYAYARLMKPKLVGGVPTYESSRFSSYA
jgi:hypothetical protein